MSKPKTIRDAFDAVAPDYKVTKELVNNLRKFEQYFVNKPNHAEFFSGNILAVNRVLFLPNDENRLVNEIIQIDDVELAEEMMSVDYFVEFRNKDIELNNASRTIYLILVWLLYKFNVSDLPKRIKEEGMVLCLLLLQYIMYTSALWNFFNKYLPSQELMEAVVEKMSLKYNIRKFKTWRNYFLYMANKVFDSKYIHKAALEHNAKDESIVYVITDNKTRINSIMKNHYALINEVKEENDHIRKTKLFVETPDGVEIKALERELSSYRDYIHSVTGDRGSFIKDDIVHAVFAIMSRKQPNGDWRTQCKEKLVWEVLKYISDNHDDNDIYKLVENIMIHSFEYVYSIGWGSYSIVMHYEIASKLKGLYQASLAKNKKLLENRKQLEKLISSNFKNNSNAAIKSTRTAVMLYIVLRALTRRNFS